MHSAFSVPVLPAALKTARWREAISATYFPQDVLIEDDERFRGNLAAWQLGDIAVSEIDSTGLRYRRRQSQIARSVDDHHLVTIPFGGDLFFQHRGKQVRCPDGAFLTEPGDETYELRQPGASKLIVLKIPESVLRPYLPGRLTFGGQVVSGHTGVAGLFIDLVRALPSRIDRIRREAYPTLSRQLLELLGLALRDADAAASGAETSMQDAHVDRIRRFIRPRLFEATLSPESIATACGVSLRYLHKLFRDRGTSVGRWIREQRLMAGDDALRDPRCRDSIAQIALRCGFSDQAQFCRHYRTHFGRTPSDTRACARAVAG